MNILEGEGPLGKGAEGHLEIEMGGDTPVKKVRVENLKGIQPGNMKKEEEKNPIAREQGMNPAADTEIGLEIGRGAENPVEEAPAQTTGGGVRELQVPPAVELEGVVAEKTETRTQKRKMVKAKVEVSKTREGVTPAMGKAEELAKRSLVMGGLLQAAPWQGVSLRITYLTKLQDPQDPQ